MLVLVLLVLPHTVHAFEIKLWPLFRYRRGPEGDVRWSALGPLIAYLRTPGEQDLLIRPLLWWHARGGPAPETSVDLLFPLAAVHRQPRETSIRVLLFSSSHGARSQRLTLFPLAFFRRDAEGHAHGGILPFYLDLPDFLGYSRVTAVAFPLYLRLAEADVEHRFFPFPFVSTVGGSAGHGLRLWPFWGHEEIAGREETDYVAWPFHIRQRTLVPGWGWDETKVDLPLRVSREGSGLTSRAYGPLAYTHTIDERQGVEQEGSPWPFVYRERPLGETTWRTWRVLPFYGRSDAPEQASRFYLWPAYRWHRIDTDGYHFERHDLLLVLGRSQEEREATTGRRDTLLTVFPLLRAATSAHHATGQMPALLDSILATNRGVLGLWAPLWGVLRWETGPTGSLDWSLLWGLLGRERGRIIGPWWLER